MADEYKSTERVVLNSSSAMDPFHISGVLKSEVIIVRYTSVVVNRNYNKYIFVFSFAPILKEKFTIVFLWLYKRGKNY